MITRGIVFGVLFVFFGDIELYAQTPASKNTVSRPAKKRRRIAPKRLRKKRKNLRVRSTKGKKRTRSAYPLELLRSPQRINTFPKPPQKPHPSLAVQSMRTIQRQSRAVRWCYERAWKQGAMPPGRLLFPLVIEISAKGRVSSIRLGNQKTKHPTIQKLEGCLSRVFRYVRFQANGRPMTIRFPISSDPVL